MSLVGRTDPSALKSHKTRTLIAIFVTGVFLLLAWGTASPASAASAEDPAVTNVRIVDAQGNPVTSASVLNGVFIDVGFAVTPTATSGDFFRVAWEPEFLKGLPKTDFPVFDRVHPDRGAVALCTVTVGELVCVYTDYVDRFDKVAGTVNFSAQLVKETTSIDFEGSGDVEYTIGIVVTPPVDPGYTPPENLQKGGYTDWATTDITWNININPQAFPGVETIHVADEEAIGLTFKPQTWFMVWRPAGGTNWVNLVPNVDYVVSFDDPDHMFTVDIVNSAERQNGGYQIGYHTDVPPDVTVGQTFENRVSAGGFSDSMLVDWNINAGGNGNGSAFGTFTINKRLAAGAEAAGASQEFAGEWSCEVLNSNEIIAGTWSVTGEGLSTLVQTTTNKKFPLLPLSTLCSATETSPGPEWLPGVISDPVAIFDGVAEITVTNELAEVPQPQTGSFVLMKTLEDPEGLAPQGARFSGSYSCVDEDGPGDPVEWELGAGERLVVSGLPLGAECSATEHEPPAVSGGTWAQPRIGPAVTITAEAEPTLEIVNVLRRSGVTPPPPTPVDPATPPPATPGQPLATTGAGELAAGVLTALGLATAGALMLYRGRRRSA